MRFYTDLAIAAVLALAVFAMLSYPYLIAFAAAYTVLQVRSRKPVPIPATITRR